MWAEGKIALLNLRSVVVIALAVAVGGLAAGLTYLSVHRVADAILAGLGAAGAGLLTLDRVVGTCCPLDQYGTVVCRCHPEVQRRTRRAESDVG